MSEAPGSARDPVVVAQERRPDEPSSASGPPLIIDVAPIDLSKRIIDADGIDYWIPHRGQMSLLDAVVWHNEDCTEGVAVKEITDDEFWVAGHFPKRPVLPGVLMIETAAQLSCILFNKSKGRPSMPSFLRIGQASFRHAVVPGDTLYLLSKVVKGGRRRFVCEVQGIVGDNNIAFDAEITGMSIGDLE